MYHELSRAYFWDHSREEQTPSWQSQLRVNQLHLYQASSWKLNIYGMRQFAPMETPKIDSFILPIDIQQAIAMFTKKNLNRYRYFSINSSFFWISRNII